MFKILRTMTFSDELFCKSLLSSFKNLPKKKKKRAKIKVLQVLLDMDDSDKDEKNTIDNIIEHFVKVEIYVCKQLR